MTMAFSVCVFMIMCVFQLCNAQFGSLGLSVGMGGIKSGDETLSIRSPCPQNTTCMPVSACPMLEDLMDFSCFSSDRYFHRLNQLICGNADDEDYVCCPSCDCGRVYQEGVEKCGQSMVRGVDYNGLGNKETGNVRFACSGSIIGKRVILTAAHCALAKPEGYKLSTVVVGEWDIGRSPDCNDYFCAPPTQAIKVENVIVHPGLPYQPFLLFPVTAAPICLNDKPEIVINERASLVGWGKLSGQNNVVSRQQQLEVPLVPLENCERIFGESVPVNEGQLCAGGEEGKDACSGFGGAPLLLFRQGRHVGIVSFGSENCGSEGVPSVYTNIAHYYRWIVDNSPS
ncbi:hypothetical protein HF086_009840 [Spodoptera exigua]|uniref:Peptidase S1 domain-containing protein n=1 Tax=Spodoptera exigua TaxID=7107 RepID=A0A922MXB1_SPOEX|nr:hypothetical protein HF086_009840 [Spodoptera exigua]